MSSTEYDLAALYEQHKNTMHRVAASALRDWGLETEADDAVQDAILSLLKSPPRESVRNWESYLVIVTKRKALDRAKLAHVAHHGGSLESMEPDVDTDEDFTQEVVNDIARAHEAAMVRDALNALGPQEKQVVWRVYGLGEKQRDVARDLGLTPGRISQVCKTGLKQLQTLINNVRIDS